MGRVATRGRRSAAYMLIVSLLCAAPATADSWLPPQVRTYEAPGARFTVTPRGIENQLAYFEDKVSGEEPAGQKPGAPEAATGVLEVQRGGQWAVAWRQALINDVAPASALVSAGGRYVVTFDDWHSVGRGDHVVTIYSADGAHVRSLSLPDLLPTNWVEALPRSVSSTWWGGTHRFSDDGERLLLQVVVPNADDDAEPSYVELPVRLADGQVLIPTSAAWTAAAAQAAETAETLRAQQAAADAAFAAPLVGPDGMDEGDWHGYLREAFFRLDPDWAETYPATKVLRAPDAPDYAASEGWLREALLERSPSTVMMLASASSPDHLATVLEQIARKARPGALRGVRIYVAAPASAYDRAAKALGRTGATVVQLDPGAPLPQRPERLQERGLID